MERRFSFAPGEFYHVYSRGVDRRIVFNDNEDRQRFLQLLYLCNSRRRIELRNLPQGLSAFNIVRENILVDIGSYCLMPNHIHLLLHEHEEGEGGAISIFMAKLLTAYAMYYNQKVGRTGTLFDRPFRARHVAEENYFHYLYAYIHLNPMKILEPEWKTKGIKDLAEAEKYLMGYNFSSYRDFIGHERQEKTILSRTAFPELFRDGGGFGSFIREWLQYRNEEITAQGSPVQ